MEGRWNCAQGYAVTIFIVFTVRAFHRVVFVLLMKREIVKQ